MEPSSADTQPTFQTPDQRPTRSRKKLAILIAAVLLVILAAVLFALLKGDKKNSNSNVDTSDSSLYYDREGYDRDNLKADIGDPFALKMTSTGEAGSVGSTKVIPACNVLTMDDLKKEQYTMQENAFGSPVQHRYLDPSGKAGFAPDANNMPTLTEAPSCYYAFKEANGELGNVAVTVNQPFTVTEKSVTNYLTNFEQKQAVNGYDVFVSKSDSKQQVARKGDVTLHFTFGLKDEAEQKSSALLKTAIANVESMKSKSKAPPKATYDSPTFTEKYAIACDLIDNDDVKSVTGLDASPLVVQQLATSIGVADFSKVSDYKTKTNYIRNQCIRSAVNPAYKLLYRSGDQSIRLTTVTYENADAAKQGLQHISIGTDNKVKEQIGGVGEETYMYKDSEGQITMVFRQGRMTAEMLLNFGSQTEDSNMQAQKMTPMGVKVAQKLADLQK